MNNQLQIREIQEEMTYLQTQMAKAVRKSKASEAPYIHSPADAAKLLNPFMSVLDHEEMWVLCMNVRNRVTDMAMVSRGNVNSAQIRIAEVFRPAIINNSSCMIISHNHPSGDPTPSNEDVNITRLKFRRKIGHSDKPSCERSPELSPR